jgi:hypothetical protein
MSSDESEAQHTQHAFLVARGWFGEHVSLIQHLLEVPLTETLSSYTPGQSSGIPGGHSGRAEVFAGHQPVRPSPGQGPA